MMHIPVLGVVENFSYLECPDCGKKINVFGQSHVDEAAKELGIGIWKTAGRSGLRRESG